MITQVVSHKQGAVRYIFDNGNEVSITFAEYSYSDNYELGRLPIPEYGRILSSSTVEIMPEGHPAFVRWMENKYEGDLVVGYVPVSEIPAILKRADSRIYKKFEVTE